MKLTKSLALLKASSTSVKVYLDFYILYVINSNLSVSVIMLYLHLLHYNKMELYSLRQKTYKFVSENFF